MWNALPLSSRKCSKKTKESAAASSAASSVVLTCSPWSAYEKPTPTGWSTKKTFACSFQPYFHGVGPLSSEIRHGPMHASALRCRKTRAGRRLTELHEETDGGRAAGAAVRPEDDVVLGPVAAGLEEVEEEVAGLDVDVARVRAAMDKRLATATPSTRHRHILDAAVAEVTFLNADRVPRVRRVREHRVLVLGEPVERAHARRERSRGTGVDVACGEPRERIAEHGRAEPGESLCGRGCAEGAGVRVAAERGLQVRAGTRGERGERGERGPKHRGG
jgi:hypothetical protein